MTSLVDALYHAKYNPFKYGEYIVSFYDNLAEVENSLLLTQLLVPLCSHPFFSQKLANAMFGEKKKSTIWTIFDDRTMLYDLQDRLDEFKELTDQSLQYTIVNDWLSVDTEQLLVLSLPKRNTPPAIHKSAVNLGKLFSNYSVIEI